MPRVPLCVPNPLSADPYDSDDAGGNILCALNAVTETSAQTSTPSTGALASDVQPAINATQATAADPRQYQVAPILAAAGVVNFLPEDQGIPAESSTRSGTVDLYLWRNLPPVGGEDTLPHIASVPIASDGSFSISTAYTSLVRDAAMSEDGYVRFLLQVTEGGFQDSHFVERRVAEQGGQLTLAGPDLRQPNPLEFTLAEDMPGVQRVDPVGEAVTLLNHYACTRKRLSDRTDVPVKVGEIHTGSNMSATAWYGHQSTISTRVSVGVRPWEGTSYTHDGMKTVTTGAENEKYYGTSYHQFLDAGFTFARVKIGGACAKEVVAEPILWDGSFESGTYAESPGTEKCRKSKGAYSTLERGKFTKNKEEARVNEDAIAVLGSGMFSQQNYGQHFRIRWNFDRGNPPWVLCGNNGLKPTVAEVVFAGS